MKVETVSYSQVYNRKDEGERRRGKRKSKERMWGGKRGNEGGKGSPHRQPNNGV